MSPRQSRAARHTYFWRRLTVALIAVVALGVIVFAIDAITHAGKIGRNVVINDIQVGGMTREEATEAVGAHAAELEALPITVVANEQTLDETPTNLGITIDVGDEVDSAFAARRWWNPFGWTASWLSPARIEFDEFNVDKAKTEAVLLPAFAGVEQPAKNATWETDGETATLVPAETGRGLDLPKAIAAIERATTSQAVSENARTAEIPVETLEPGLTTEAAKAMGIADNVGTYTTKFPSGQSRVKNIERISELVNGTIIAPGEKFSINDSVGERTEDKGFVEGGVIDAGRFTTDIGGGVSQYATTLFNAAFFAGTPIPEFRAHSFYISRYPLGREATLAWPNIDLVIENNFDSHLLIRSDVGASSITVGLYGTDDGRKVTESTGKRENYTDPKVSCIRDSDLKAGRETVTQSAAKGFSVRISRTVVFADGTDDLWEFTTVYRPKNKVISYNPSPAAAPAPPASTPESEDPPETGEDPAPTTTTTTAPPAPSLSCPGVNGDPL